MKQTGIVKAVSKKSGGRTAFTLVGARNDDGTDIWFNGDTFIAEKGDAIEFELSINGIWHNFKDVIISAKGAGATQPQQPQQPQQPTTPQPTQPMPQQPTNQIIMEQAIAFIELNGRRFKITLEESN